MFERHLPPTGMQTFYFWSIPEDVCFFRLTIEAFYSKITTFWTILKIWNIAARLNTNNLVLFLPNILEKLRLLSYFQGIKYFMANQNTLFLSLK